MTAVGIIPVRYGATRFPGKPLTPIAGTHVPAGVARVETVLQEQERR